ncbi:multicopper oxidase domain-containing protein, partial [Ilumatobacter sp.]|uniref:multicopper oxidase domain-containing protein n=1 Tax=Ilumatobacter sp. TaxID=1967498 RepID=UPI003C5337A2
MADSPVDQPTSTTSRWATIGPALLLAVGVIMWQHLLHAKFVLRTHDDMLDHLPHIGRDALFAIPFAFIALSCGRFFTLAITIRQPRAGLFVRAAIATEVFFVLMLAGVPAHGLIDERLGGGHVHEGSVLGHALRDSLIGQAVALPLLVVGLWLVGPGRKADRHVRWFIIAAVAVSPALLLAGVSGFVVLAVLAVFGLASAPRTDVRERRVGILSMALILSAVVVPSPLQSPSVVSAAGEECSAAAPIRQYDVAAIDVDIVFNAFGDHDPEGKMFVLRDRIDDVRDAEASGEVTPGLRDDAIQPLVIRANLGDCLEIEFHNDLVGRDASFHVTGLPFTAANAGGNVGFNPNSLAAPGDVITYRFQVPTDPYAEGAYVFNSMSDTRYTMSHGLFGTLVLEPEGSRYLDPADPSTELESGWEAIIADPNGADFREFNILFHEIGNEDF